MKNKTHLNNQVLFSVYIYACSQRDLNSLIDEHDISNVIYLSDYSPTAIILATEEQIESISRDERCIEKGLFRDKKSQKQSAEILKQIEGDSVLSNNTSFRVGMISAEAEIFISDSPQLEPYLDRITVLPYRLPAIPSLHPSVVLSSLIGAQIVVDNKIYRGIAEGTPVLFSTSETSIDVFNIAEMMLGMGVNTINFSAGILNPEGYSEFDALLDRLIENSNLLFVTASGNRRVVSSPGISYNTLTVGNLQTKQSPDEILSPPWNSYCINRVNCSGYLADSTTAHKPDVVAPGSYIPYITPSGEVYSQNTGTSFACPWVTGTAILIKSRFPSLTSLELKVLIALSCNREVISDEFNPIIDGEQLIRLRTGCGAVSVERALRFAEEGEITTVITEEENTVTKDLSQGEALYVGICFNQSRDRGDSLSLEIEGKILCDRPWQNLHIIEYTATENETVNIKITGTPNIECARVIFKA